MSIVVRRLTYDEQVDVLLEYDYPASVNVDSRNDWEYKVFSSYHSMVKYVGRHVSDRTPSTYEQVPEGHEWLRREVARLHDGLQKGGRRLPPVFTEMVLHLIDNTTMTLSDELYGGVFAREILGLVRFNERSAHECGECLVRILNGAGYDRLVWVV